MIKSLLGSTSLDDIRPAALRFGASVNPLVNTVNNSGADPDEFTNMPFGPAADTDADELADVPLGPAADAESSAAATNFV